MANLGELTVWIKIDPAAVTNMTKQIQSGADKASESVDGIGKSAADSGKALNQMGGEWAKAGKKAGDALDKAGKKADSFSATLRNAIGIVGSLLALDFFKRMAEGAVTLASNLQQAQVSFTTMLGSAGKADQLLRELSDFARTTPFELVGIRENAKQLLAMGVAQENLLPTLKVLGDVASGLSVPLDRLALVYGQVLSKGRLMGDDLKQFTEAGVPLLAQLANQTGKTTGEIAKLIEKGQISAVEVTKALETMTGEGGKFENLMAKQAETVAGKWSNLQDSINLLGETVGTRFLPTLGTVVDGMGNVVENYGNAIADVITSTFEYVAKTFSDIAKKTEDASEDQLRFGKVVLHVANVVTAWFRTVFALITTMGRTIGAVFAGIVNAGWHAFLTVADVSRLAFSSILAVGKDFSNAFWAVFQNAAALAVEKMNSLITSANGILWTSFKTLAPIARAEFSTAITWPLDAISDRVKLGADRIREDVGKIAGSFVEDVKDDWLDLGASVVTSLDAIASSGTEAGKTMKKIGKIDTSKIQATGWAAANASKKAAEAAKKEAEQIKAEIDRLKDAYREMESVRKRMNDASEKYAKAENDRIKKTVEELNKISDAIAKNEKAYEDALAKIAETEKNNSQSATESFVRSQAERQASIEKSLSDLEKQYEADKRDAANAGELFDSKKIEDYDEKRRALQNELATVKANLASLTGDEAANLSELLETERKRAELSADERTKFDYSTRIEAIKAESEAQRVAAKQKLDDDNKVLERQRAIYEFFRARTQLTPSQLAEIQKSEQFQTATGDEQNLILKLGNEMVAITQQKFLKLGLEKELAAEVQELSDLTTQNAIKNVEKLKLEYRELIAEIQAAVSAQRSLASLSASASGSRGFADGGYTGDGARNDVAGIVHKGEYVIPQHVISKVPGILPALESVRTWSSIDNSRRVEISGPISVSESLDFELLLRKALWRM